MISLASFDHFSFRSGVFRGSQISLLNASKLCVRKSRSVDLARLLPVSVQTESMELRMPVTIRVTLYISNVCTHSFFQLIFALFAADLRFSTDVVYTIHVM